MLETSDRLMLHQSEPSKTDKFVLLRPLMPRPLPKRARENRILHPSVYRKMKDMQQAADTMHMYFAIWIGRLQHSRASIHPALLLLLLLLLPPLLPLLRLCLLSATRSYSFSVNKKILILPQGRLPSDCWNACLLYTSPSPRDRG